MSSASRETSSAVDSFVTTDKPSDAPDEAPLKSVLSGIASIGDPHQKSQAEAIRRYILTHDSPSQLNGFVKSLLLHLHGIYFLIGLAFIAIGLYFLFADLGKLDPELFASACIICCIFGIVVLVGSIIGAQSIEWQTISIDRVSGRQVAFITIALLISYLVLIVYALQAVLSVSSQYEYHTSLLAEGNIFPPYEFMEETIADYFNSFFFGASTSCDSPFYSWLWSAINDYCPVAINQSHCQGCLYYSATMCAAYQPFCDLSVSPFDSYSKYCPYTLCRSGVLKYFHDNVEPAAMVLGIILIVHSLVLTLTVMLWCYHPHDNIRQILVKVDALPADKAGQSNASISRRRAAAAQKRVLHPSQKGVITTKDSQTLVL